MMEEFELHEKLCFIDKTAFTEKDISFLDPPLLYNGKVKKALDAQLPTFAVLDDGKKPDEQLCLLVERDNFWGMGYLPASQQIRSIDQIKSFLQPYADNDTIRNSIYSFVEQHPSQKIMFTVTGQDAPVYR